MTAIRINDAEQDALAGLPHLQRVLYVALRARMDFASGLVGVRVGVSYQALREDLCVEPIPGVRTGAPSRDQVRRALAGLVRAGLVEMLSEGRELRGRLLLADTDASARERLRATLSRLPASELAAVLEGERARVLKVLGADAPLSVPMQAATRAPEAGAAPVQLDLFGETVTCEVIHSATAQAAPPQAALHPESVSSDPTTVRRAARSALRGGGLARMKGSKEEAQRLLPLLGVLQPPTVRALIWPEGLGAPLRASCSIALLPADDALAQQIVDELAAGLAGGKVRSPVGWVRAVLERARAGEFVPEAGLVVAEARARRAEAEARLRAAEQAPPPALTMQGAPPASAARPPGRGAAGRAELRAAVGLRRASG